MCHSVWLCPLAGTSPGRQSRRREAVDPPRDSECRRQSHNEYPEITVSEPGVFIEVRGIAIDSGRCRTIIEQGRFQETPTDPVKGEEQITEQVPEATAGRAGSPALLATSTASVYNWWEDILGIRMTQDRTNVSRSYNGSCSLVGSTSGQWTWATGTGGGSYLTAGMSWKAVRKGETKSTFNYSWFCAPLPTVYTYSYHVRVYGQENGSITGSRSTDSVDECAPFWMHYSVQKVT